MGTMWYIDESGWYLGGTPVVGYKIKSIRYIITDLALQAYQLLRQDLQELINEMEEVEPWDEG